MTLTYFQVSSSIGIDQFVRLTQWSEKRTVIDGEKDLCMTTSALNVDVTLTWGGDIFYGKFNSVSKTEPITNAKVT